MTTLRVNPIACSGHGLCAELLPELITLDEWGYPVISGRQVSASLTRQARRAVTACPALALQLRRSSEDTQTDRRGQRGKLER